MDPSLKREMGFGQEPIRSMVEPRAFSGSKLNPGRIQVKEPSWLQVGSKVDPARIPEGSARVPKESKMNPKNWTQLGPILKQYKPIKEPS